MAPEYGGYLRIFSVDESDVRLFTLNRRDEQTIALVEAYAKAQGLWHARNSLIQFLLIVYI